MTKEIVQLARAWIGTPYRHQGSLKGVGCDCLGLVRGIFREVHGAEPEEPGAYGMDWAERSGEERLLSAAARHLGTQLAFADAEIGDLLIFRWRQDYAAKHCGILSGDGRFIHAYEQAGVVESPLTIAWTKRIAGVFRFTSPDQNGTALIVNSMRLP